MTIKGKFVEEIVKKGGNIFLVGGIVRDYYLSEQNKDIDLLVSGIHLDKLLTILSKYGAVDVVGESFGVIKFKDKETEIEYDIALPRKEIKNGSGHKGFDVIVNHEFSVLDDLERRDFTINAIAIEVTENTVVDPFNGVLDLNNKILRCVSEKSFIEDPLRILRGLQFSARFGFEIEERTKKLIFENIHSLKEISKERVYIEFEKGFVKGDPIKFLELIKEFDLDVFLLGIESNEITDELKIKFEKSKTFSERLFLSFHKGKNKTAEILRTELMLPNKVFNEIKALIEINKDEVNPFNFFESCKYDDSIGIETDIFLSADFKIMQNKFINNEFPTKITKLDVNGGDLQKYGFFGVDIKNKQLEMISKIFKGEVKNNKLELLIKLI